jgi:hypothetical protein
MSLLLNHTVHIWGYTIAFPHSEKHPRIECHSALVIQFCAPKGLGDAEGWWMGQYEGDSYSIWKYNTTAKQDQDEPRAESKHVLHIH